MITIVDYGMGNLGSVQNMFKKIGVPSSVNSDPEEIRKAKKILLPGVGAFDAAMQRINESRLKEILDKKALEEKVPVLGICLGMQLLMEASEEGFLPGLGWIKGRVMNLRGKIPSSYKVPHMGWNQTISKQKSPLTENLPDEPRFYFVHSYYVNCQQEQDVLCTTQYGIHFHSMISHNNIYGAQFHPEKSHKFGMKLFENFAQIKC